MSDLRSDLEGQLNQVAVDLDAAHTSVLARSRRLKVRRRALQAAGAALALVLVMGVVALRDTSNHEGSVIVGPVDTAPTSDLLMAPDGVTATVVAAYEIRDPTANDQSLVIVIRVENGGTSQIMGQLPGMPGHEGTLSQHGVVIAQQQLNEHQTSRVDPIQPNELGCWTQAYPGFVVSDRSTEFVMTVPTVVPNGGPSSVLELRFNPELIKPIAVSDYQRPTRGNNCV